MLSLLPTIWGHLAAPGRWAQKLIQPPEAALEQFVAHTLPYPTHNALTRLDRYSLSGAQDPDTFQQIFEGLLQERERDVAAAAGKAQAAGAACDPKTGQCV